MDVAAVVIASNRGPIEFHRADDGTITASRGAGGLVSAMSGLASDGDTVWICAALSELDAEVASAAPDCRIDRAGHDEAGAVAMLPIDPSVLAGAYNAIANTTLWFLHHGMIDESLDYGEEWRANWQSYVDYNASFADAVAAVAADDARVLVQDYHLALLPAMLRERRPDLRIGHFTHTPWAPPPAFAALPTEIGSQLLRGMLGADSAGFHSSRWAEEFVGCCVSTLGAEEVEEGVRYGGRVTAVRVHPLGVDAAPLLARAAAPDVAERRSELAAEIADRCAIARVDRAEPSKNIARGLKAYRALLARYPEHHEKVVHVSLAYPSRQSVEAYRTYTELVTSLAEAINTEYATATWTPVLMTVKDDYARSLATLQIADVLLINPIRDGMNLVAKEGALLTDDAVLVLSSEAGAADDMGEFALLVDPLDVNATADALHTALRMPADERAKRHAGLVSAATALPPKKWLQQQLDALA